MKYERDKEYALKVIDSCLYGTLSLIDVLGQPYGIPMSLARIGDNIYFHGSLKGKKIEAFKKNTKASLSCVGNTKVVPEKFTTIYRSAIVEGDIEIVEDEKEKIAGLKALVLKYTPSVIDRFDEEIDKSLKHTMVFKLKIAAISGKGKL